MNTGCVVSLPSGGQPALSSSAIPDIVSTTTMPRRITDCGTRGATALPMIVPGTDPTMRGMVIDQSTPWLTRMLATAADSTSGTACTRSVPTSFTAARPG